MSGPWTTSLPGKLTCELREITTARQGPPRPATSMAFPSTSVAETNPLLRRDSGANLGKRLTIARHARHNMRLFTIREKYERGFSRKSTGKHSDPIDVTIAAKALEDMLEPDDTPLDVALKISRLFHGRSVRFRRLNGPSDGKEQSGEDADGATIVGFARKCAD